MGDEANVDVQTLIGRNILTGSAEVTGSLKVTSDISSSTISGIGNVTLYSASVAASITSSTANVTLLSQSLYFTDTTQSVNITQASASAWGAFQSASAYSASGYQVNATQSFQITANALTASNALSSYSSSQSTLNNTLSSSIATVSSSVGLLQTFSGSEYKADSSSFDSRLDTQEFKSTTFATTGSNSFIGDQLITGSVIISSSAATDLLISGTAAIVGTLRITGSTGISNILNLGNITISSGSTSNVIMNRTIGFYNTSGSSQIGITAGTTTFGLAPSIFASSGSGFINYSVIKFEDGGAYTDGRVTFPTPISASAGITSSNAFINGELYSVTSASFDSRINAAGGTQVLLDEGTILGNATAFNFIGSGVTATLSAGTASVTIPGGGGSIYTGSFAITGSNTFSGSQIINGNVNITGSLTASGLKYPTTDGTAGQFILTDGVGTLAFDDVHVLLEDVRYGEDITLGDPLYVNGSNGNRPIVFKADASNPAKMPVIYIAKSTGVTNTNTTALTLGLITGVTTTGYAAGTTIYIAEGGGWTSSRPSGSTSIVQPLGIVTKEGAGGSGRGLILNAGPAFLPNIQTGYTWVGNGTNQPTAVATSSFVNINQTGSFATTGSNSFVGNQTISGSLILSSSAVVELKIVGGLEITGSVSTQPIALSVTSNTASIDFSKGSIFTLTLPSSSVKTYITASNLIPGQTANLLVTQASALSGSIQWATAFKFPSGSSYTGSAVISAVDLVSFITVNNSTIYSVGAQNLI